jgi:hypothetical protein
LQKHQKSSGLFASLPSWMVKTPASNFPSAHQGNRTYCRSPDNSATISYTTYAFFSESPYSAGIPQIVPATPEGY